MTARRRPWLWCFVAFAAVALVACSGDDGGEEAEADAEATETPSEGFMAAPPSSLASYAYQVSVAMSPEALDTSEAPAGLDLGDEDFTFDIVGEVVNPDREHATTTANLGFLSLTLEAIRVGEQEWTKQDDGDWQPSTAGDALGALLGETDFSPGSIFTTDEGYSFEDLTARLEAHGWEDEEVDGRPARHFTFTQEEFYQVFQTERQVLPPEVDATIVADLWIAEDLGVPLKMTVIGTDSADAEVLNIEMTLTDLNGEFAIEPPI